MAIDYMDWLIILENVLIVLYNKSQVDQWTHAIDQEKPGVI